MENTAYNNEVVAFKLKKKDTFICTPFVKDMASKMIKYLNAGYPVHLQGPSGTGKSTLAMYVASCFDTPVMLMHGNDEFKPSDLIGSETGYRREKVIDNFIHTVLKTVDNFQKKWVDNQLTVACREGYILIYDEFTRSRPETNNILLSILEEKMLEMPNVSSNEGFLKVHPDFKVIFTSNPDEYAGVHKVQDALMDRMININMGYLDGETEKEIVRVKSGLKYEAADKVVNLIRKLRESDVCKDTPSIRSGIMIAIIAKKNNINVDKKENMFRKVVYDLLGSKIIVDSKAVNENIMKREKILDEFIEKYC